MVCGSQYQGQEKSWNGNPPHEENQNVKESGQDAERNTPTKASWQHRANISWKSILVSVQFAGERPNHVENNRAHGNCGKVPQCPPKRGLDRCGLLPKLGTKTVQRSRMEQQGGRHDNDCEENVKAKLPKLGFRDKQPRRKKCREDRIDEKLQQP
jgi:hypothetical protein